MRWNFNLILLAGVADVWRTLRAEFDFGALAPREAIEERWQDVLDCVEERREQLRQPESPFLELSAAMFRDEELVRDLSQAWRRVRVRRRRGYTIEEVRQLALTLLFLRSVRCAHRYLLNPVVPPRGWANPFWTTRDDRLARDLEEAVDARYREDTPGDGEGGCVPQFSQLPPADGAGAAPDYEKDVAGRTSGGVPADVDFEPQLELLGSELSAPDFELFRDWWRNHQVDDNGTIAQRHDRPTRYLTKLLARAAAIIRRNLPPTGGQQ